MTWSPRTDRSTAGGASVPDRHPRYDPMAVRTAADDDDPSIAIEATGPGEDRDQQHARPADPTPTLTSGGRREVGEPALAGDQRPDDPQAEQLDQVDPIPRVLCDSAGIAVQHGDALHRRGPTPERAEHDHVRATSAADGHQDRPRQQHHLGRGRQRAEQHGRPPAAGCRSDPPRRDAMAQKPAMRKGQPRLVTAALSSENTTACDRRP